MASHNYAIFIEFIMIIILIMAFIYGLIKINYTGNTNNFYVLKKNKDYKNKIWW